MKKQTETPKTLGEKWPEIHKIAVNIQRDVCQRINSVNIRNNPQIEKEIGNCEYWRQGLLETIIAELEKCV